MEIGTQNNPPHAVDKYLVFVFGVIFISVLLYLVTEEKNPTGLEIKIYNTVLALAAGGIGAVLPGTIEIKYKGLLRAGGAIGLGVFVYATVPAMVPASPEKFQEPPTSPRPVADAFLKALDSRDPNASWKAFSDSGRGQLDNDESLWQKLYQTDIAPRGDLKSRDFKSITELTSPPGVPPGIYEYIAYETRYSNDAKPRPESITVQANRDKWGVYSYMIGPEETKP